MTNVANEDPPQRLLTNQRQSVEAPLSFNSEKYQAIVRSYEIARHWPGDTLHIFAVNQAPSIWRKLGVRTTR
jgi:hypothetical protein